MTLNQVVARIRTLAESHGNIKSFFLGDPWELEHQPKGQVQFSCLLCQLTNAIIGKGQTRIDLTLYFMDLVVAEESNELDVQSDMLSVAQDFMAMLRNPVYNDWAVSDSSSGPFFTEKFESSVAGLRIDVAFIIDNAGDRCAVPLND